MTLAFYDRSGRPFAYCEDGVHIYAWSGLPLGYIQGETVYAFDGRARGWLAAGWMRAADGGAIAFTDAAEGGPDRPGKVEERPRGPRKPLPWKAPRQAAPAPCAFAARWSATLPERFFL